MNPDVSEAVSVLERTPAILRAALLQDLPAGWKLGPRQLASKGLHPELGGVTLGQLLSTWVVHDLYLGILNR